LRSKGRTCPLLSAHRVHRRLLNGQSLEQTLDCTEPMLELMCCRGQLIGMVMTCPAQGTPRRANPRHQIGITYELLEACQLSCSRGLAHLGELTIPELVQARFQCLPTQECPGSRPRPFQTQLGMGR